MILIYEKVINGVRLICKGFGDTTDASLNSAKLKGHKILKYVSYSEFENRARFPATNGTHAANRLRSLSHWQCK